MNSKTIILAGLLSTAAWAADPAAVVDPTETLKEVAKDAAVAKGKEATGVSDETLDQIETVKEVGAEAQEAVEDPSAVTEELKAKATGAAIEKATEALTAPAVPKSP